MLTAFGKGLPGNGATLLAKRNTNFLVTTRNFASSAHHDDLHETQKWEKITYVGIATCLVLAIYNLSKGHRHSEEPSVMYPYMHIRNKDYPWGPESLFEKFKKKQTNGTMIYTCLYFLWCKILYRTAYKTILGIKPYETQKWEKITYVGIATCLALAIYNLSKGHRHSEEPSVMYPYMHIRNKDYPWGPESLFEKFKKKHD